ncbi:MAG: CARDB domain-containing protein, partial [Nanoarchaeota archaeon]
MIKTLSAMFIILFALSFAFAAGTGNAGSDGKKIVNLVFMNLQDTTDFGSVVLFCGTDQTTNSIFPYLTFTHGDNIKFMGWQERDNVFYASWVIPVDRNLKGIYEAGCILDGYYNLTDLTKDRPYPGTDVLARNFIINSDMLNLDIILKSLSLPSEITEDMNSIKVKYQAETNFEKPVEVGFELKIDDSLIKTGRIVLKPGVENYEILINNEFSVGSHNLELQIDTDGNANGEIQETNENNNKISRQFEVVIVPEDFDLFISNLTHREGFSENDTILIRFNTHNTGDADLNVPVAVFIDGQKLNFPTTLPFPAGERIWGIGGIGPLNSGQHTFKLIIDPENNLPESNENNNIKELQFNINVAPNGKIIDIVDTDLILDDLSNGKLVVTCSVEDQFT